MLAENQSAPSLSRKPQGIFGSDATRLSSSRGRVQKSQSDCVAARRCRWLLYLKPNGLSAGKSKPSQSVPRMRQFSLHACDKQKIGVPGVKRVAISLVGSTKLLPLVGGNIISVDAEHFCCLKVLSRKKRMPRTIPHSGIYTAVVEPMSTFGVSTVMMDNEVPVHGHRSEPLAVADHLSFTPSLLLLCTSTTCRSSQQRSPTTKQLSCGADDHDQSAARHSCS